ncbi:MAG TPA: family 43 glycosylhydrolase [Candidatus Ornithomonoglobus intestinigallinarum]|uniref:Family 43 glycosylhydrolase n=1 Tax=Candidatus Ornithomonoglobus intestinigallinarum TaxID=2840894 RepID=A0A9D1KPS3_9FIRM|nr:family 43 glycosylhydrolase [Candidatus Ornithomonoglobus intestinigallinarum]
MKTAKRLTAVLCSLAMTLSVWIAPVSAADTELPEPVIDVTFDDGGDGYTLNGASLAEGEGVTGNAISTGTDKYASANDVSALSGVTEDFTFSVWIYPTGSEYWQRAFDFGTGTGKYVFLAPTSDFPRFVMTTGGNAAGAEQILIGTNRVTQNEWNNITVTRSGNTTSMYVNGVPSGSTTGITLNPSDFSDCTNNYFGKSQYADPYFSGMIDDFKVYSTALSEAQAEAMYNDGIAAMLAKQNRLDIDVNFYDEDGNEIYQAQPNSTITAMVDIKNYTPEEARIELRVRTAHVIPPTATLVVEAGRRAEFDIDIDTDEAKIRDDLDVYTRIEIILSDQNGKQYNGGYIEVTDSPVEFPPASPEDSDPTTFGAHDPTIFKDPVDGKYWAYSSHNLVYESDDLINWIEHDYTQQITVPEKAKEFIAQNYSDQTANATYWAPDLLYVEGDEYPYWFYLSVSTGVGGQNSVITLVKAKSPGLWDGETQDCGVVLASKPGYTTNAIDANIYTENGVNYFIWGSFWRGILGAKLTDDGRVEGVDYTSDAKIIETSKDVGARLFSTPDGIMGPEGPFTIKNPENNNIYMFTSYGWLGSNYNCRIARTDASMADVLGQANPHTRFRDASGNQVGTAYAQQSDPSLPWGYKLIGSYKIGDGITYYGNGHNSVLHDDDENWYYVQHSRKVPEAAAYLQVRKMLWTEDGWPVVSPVVYAGEKEQAVTETMLYGTWDITSVGTTLYDTGVTSADDSGAYKGADMPVESYELILKPDHTFEKGTWEFDGDHTITVKFTKDGNKDKNEYFYRGDVMTLFVLPGYDKDARRSVLTVTGINRNFTANNGTGSNTDYITNFGIKSNAMTTSTAPEEPPAPEFEDITNDFEDLQGTIISQQRYEQLPCETKGAQLYVGTRSSGGDSKTGWLSKDGGVTGKALVLSSARWSDDRGPRIGFTTPDIQNGGTATLEISVNIKDNALRYNDNTTSGGDAVDITPYFTQDRYDRLKITVENHKDSFTRIFYVNDTEIARDSGSAFPVLWGISEDNNSGNPKEIYFDDLYIHYDASVEIKPLAAAVEEAERTEDTVSFTLKDAAVFGSVDTYVAQYDADGALIGIDKASVTVTSDEQIVSVDYKKAENAASYKLFVWYNMMAAAQDAELE